MIGSAAGTARRACLALAACILLSACGDEEAVQSQGPAPTPIAQPSTGKPAVAPPKGEAPKPDKPAKQADSAVPIGDGFDFYVLALMWSPSYCAAEGADANRQQCSRPYSFAVHGLWPQFEKGWPQDCSTDEPDVTNETMRSLYDIIPAAGLIRYQWRKHGSCAGLSQRDYFRVLRAAREKVAVPNQYADRDTAATVTPDSVERAFLSANPGLPANGAAVICDERFMREIRICLTRELEFRSCPEVDRRDCRLKSAEMPPVRGG